MARTVSRPSQDYAPTTVIDPNTGLPVPAPVTLGPFAVDGFNRNNAEYFEWTATVEGWPADATLLLFKVRLTWDVGYPVTWDVYGDPRDRQGEPMTLKTERAQIPREASANGKARATSGTIFLEVHSAFRTAFAARVV